MKLNLNNFYIFEIMDKTFIIDLKYKFFFSVKSSYFTEDKLIDPESVLNKAILQKRDMYSILLNESVNSVYLLVTDKCNLACEFCCIRANETKEEYNKLDYVTIKKRVIPILKQLNPRKIIVSGGEPLTNGELIPILRLIREESSSMINLQTNGTLVTSSFLEEISDVINNIEVSTAHFSNYNSLYSIARKCNSLGIGLTLSYTYQNDINSLFRIIDFVVNNNVSFVLNFITKSGSALDNNIEILKSENKIDIFKKVAQYLIEKDYCNNKIAELFFSSIPVRQSCNALGNMLSVYPDGNLYLCHSLNIPEFSAGNIFGEPSEIIENWKELISREYVKNLFEVDRDKKCVNCKYKYLCGGFCGELVYNQSVTPDACLIQKFFILYKLIVYDHKITNKENLRDFIEFSEQLDKVELF